MKKLTRLSVGGAAAGLLLVLSSGCGPVSPTNANFDAEKARMEQKYGKPTDASPQGRPGSGMRPPPGATGMAPPGASSSAPGGSGYPGAPPGGSGYPGAPPGGPR